MQQVVFQAVIFGLGQQPVKFVRRFALFTVVISLCEFFIKDILPTVILYHKILEKSRGCYKNPYILYTKLKITPYNDMI